MPSFCSLLLPLAYSNNFVGKIDASLLTGYNDELNNMQLNEIVLTFYPQLIITVRQLANRLSYCVKRAIFTLVYVQFTHMQFQLTFKVMGCQLISYRFLHTSIWMLIMLTTVIFLLLFPLILSLSLEFGNIQPSVLLSLISYALRCWNY